MYENPTNMYESCRFVSFPYISEPRARVPCPVLPVVSIIMRHSLGLEAYVGRARSIFYKFEVHVRLGHS